MKPQKCAFSRNAGRTLIILSLGLNGVLGLSVGGAWHGGRQAANIKLPPAPPPATVRAPLVQAPDGGTGAQEARSFKDPLLESDVYRVMDKMMADGYSKNAITGAVLGTAHGRNDAEHERVKVLARAKWKPGSEAAATRYRELEKALLVELMGTINRFNEADQKAWRAHDDWLLYGDLGAEKVDALKKLENRANGVVEGSSRGIRFGGNGTVLADFSAHESAVRELLSPAEADDYLRYNTAVRGSPAEIVQRLLQPAQYTQEQYVRIIDHASQLSRATPGVQLESAMTDTLVEVLEPVEFLKLVPSINLPIATADSYFESIGVRPEARVAKYREIVALGRGAAEQRARELTRLSPEDLVRLGIFTPGQLDASAQRRTLPLASPRQ